MSYRDRFVKYLARLVTDKVINEAQALAYLEGYDNGEIDEFDLPVAPGDIEDDPDWETVALLLLLLLRGQPLSPPTSSAFVRTVDKVQNHFEDKVIELAKRYSSRDIDVSTWQREMYDATRTHTGQQMMVGAGSTVLTAEQMQRHDDIMTEEEAFLSRFADRIASGTLTGESLSEAQIAARSNQYAGTGRGEAFRVREDDPRIGWVVDYITRDDRFVCGSCIVAGLMSPYLIGQGPMPGQVCQGRSRCRCVRRFRFDPVTYEQLLVAPTPPPTMERINQRTAQLQGIRSRIRTIRAARADEQAVQASAGKGTATSGEQPLSVSAIKPSKKGVFNPDNPADVRRQIAEINSVYGPQLIAITKEVDRLFIEFTQLDNRILSTQRIIDKHAGAPEGVTAIVTLAKQKAEHTETGRQLMAAQAERTRLKTESHDKISPLLAVHNPASVKIEPKNTDPGDMKQWQGGVDIFNRLVSSDLYFPESVKFARTETRENYLVATKTVLARSFSSPHVVAHEMGHWLEDHSPTVKKRATAFFERRTAGEAKAQLPGQPEGEVGKKDNFIHPYMGREYTNSAGKKLASEIVSMGIEYMHNDPAMFAARDPDYFDFMFNLLRGK